MKIIIFGDGKVGAALTEHLSKEGHDVVVVDKDPQVVEEMVNQYDVMGISGNGASRTVPPGSVPNFLCALGAQCRPARTATP